MPTSASGSYSLPTLRFQNSKPGLGSDSAGHTLFNTLGDMASGIREARIQGGGGGGGTGSISTGQIASFTACVGDVLSTAVRVGDGLTLSVGTHNVEVKVSAIATSMIPSFTACARDAANGGLVAGNGITFSTSGHSLEIKTATLTVGQMLSFTANVGQAINVGITAGTAIVLSFNAATNVTEIRASITSGGGIASFTACVGDAMFPNLKAGTNVAYSFNAGTHQTEINVTGSLGAISSLTASVKEIVTVQTTTRYLNDYGAVGDGASHPLTESFSTTASAIVFYPYMTSLSQQKDYLALLTALYDAPAGSGGGGNDMVHVQMGANRYFWGTDTFQPTRCIKLTGVGAMEGSITSRIYRNPVGHGIVIDQNAAAGSWFEGFRLDMNSTLNGHTGYCGGIIREYNPATGLALVGSNDTTTTMTSSTTFEVRALFSLGQTAYATFIPTGIVDPFGVPTHSIEITTDGNLFTLGETVSWPSGGSAVVAYIGNRVRCLWVTTPVGTSPAAGDVVTGGTSGATGRVVEFRLNGVEPRAITVLSGTVDNDGLSNDPDSYEHYCRQGQFGHGMLLQRRCYAHNVKVVAASGNGIYIAAGGGGYSGNANLARLTRIDASDNGGNGVGISGADANVCTVAEGTFTENSGYGVMDNSFLGCVVYGNHISSGAIGGYYFGGGASISFGNYAEGNQDKLPLKRKATRIRDSHLDMCGTSGIPRIVRGSGAQITAGDCTLAWVSYDDDTKVCKLHSGGGTTGGVNDNEVACLTVEKGGDRSSGIGSSIEFAIPWDAGTDYNFSHDLAIPACRMIAKEEGAFGQTGFTIKTMRTMGSYAVRARTGSSFKGRIKVASAGTITSVETLMTGDSSTTFSDTISIVNPGAGVGAVLIPVVRQGRIESVYVQSGGSGYTNSYSFVPAVDMRYDYLRVWSNVSGQEAQLLTGGLDVDVDLGVYPKGAGFLKTTKIKLPGTTTIVAGSSTASSDLTLTPSGNGRVRFGSFTTTAAAMTIQGWIEIRDAAGNIRKVAILA